MMERYKAVILYLFFGGCTTLVNILLYALCYEWLSWGNVPSTCLAWVGSVMFAFVTNKLWVFGSRGLSPCAVLRECSAFLLCRVATGVLDVGIMYMAVDLLCLAPLPWKVVSNVVVVIANWLVSKNCVFVTKDNRKVRG